MLDFTNLVDQLSISILDGTKSYISVIKYYMINTLTNKLQWSYENNKMTVFGW